MPSTLPSAMAGGPELSIEEKSAAPNRERGADGQEQREGFPESSLQSDGPITPGLAPALPGLPLAFSPLIRAVMWQVANEVTPCPGSTLSGGRGNQDRPRESFTIISVLPAMDRKQKQAEKVRYAHAAVINPLRFFPAPLLSRFSNSPFSGS